jgi:hypothetical protein
LSFTKTNPKQWKLLKHGFRESGDAAMSSEMGLPRERAEPAAAPAKAGRTAHGKGELIREGIVFHVSSFAITTSNRIGLNLL